MQIIYDLEPQEVLDHMAELKDSIGHAVVQGRIDQEVNRTVAKLIEERLSEADTQYYRGVAKGLRTAAAIPTILQTEAREQLKTA